MNSILQNDQIEYVFSVKMCLSSELSCFTCQYETALSYIGCTARHLVTRAREHLNFNSAAESAIKDHVYSCFKCIQTHFSVHDFTVLKNCLTEYEAKIQEAVVIKKQNPKLYCQLCATGLS